jgi:hypothetical protein
MVSFLFLLMSVSLSQASALSESFQLEFSGQSQGAVIRVFSGTEHEAYDRPAVESPASVVEFRKEVRARTETDPVFLLKRQRAVFEKAGAEDYLPRFDLVLSQKLYPISLLEEMLLELHAELLGTPLFGSYSEFGASLLVGPHGKLVIIFISNPSEAMVPASSQREAWLKKYLAKGYRFKVHIHNHPFNFSNPADIGGTPIPSGFSTWGDVGVYVFEKKKFSLENAWITNGFHTLRIPARDFEKY